MKRKNVTYLKSPIEKSWGLILITGKEAAANENEGQSEANNASYQKRLQNQANILTKEPQGGGKEQWGGREGGVNEGLQRKSCAKNQVRTFNINERLRENIRS